MHDIRSTRSSGGRSVLLRLLALLAVFTLVAAACGDGRDDDDTSGATRPTSGGGGDDDDGGDDGGEEPLIDASNCPGDPMTGIEGDTIKLGTSLPQSGLYSAFTEILKGELAYFEYVNEELGGVEIAGKKYQIELVDMDDEYQAEKTVNNVNELINDEQVFALFNVVGTKNNLAIRDLVNEQCVPSLFAATGSTAWGNMDYPWLLGSELVPYPLEVKAFVDYLLDTKPDAKVAILRASDDFGRAYSDTFKRLIEGTDLTLAKEETYNPEQFETGSQITSLAATDADALIIGATLLACPDAIKNVTASGWKPIIYMSGTCTSKTLMTLAEGGADGVISVGPLMDPASPEYADQEAMKLYQATVPKYQPDSDPTNGIVAYGWTTAALLVDMLSQVPTLDRVSVMETARQYSAEGVGLMLPGQRFEVSADDWFLGEMFNLVQYSLADGYFSPIGRLHDESGKTADYTPAELIEG